MNAITWFLQKKEGKDAVSLKLCECKLLMLSLIMQYNEILAASAEYCSELYFGGIMLD